MVEPGTPLPWEAQKADPTEGVGIIGVILNDAGEAHFTPTNGLVAMATMFPTEFDARDTARAEANAAYIVRACNSYPALLEALEAITLFHASGGHEGRWSEVEAKANAAIAQAKGEVA